MIAGPAGCGKTTLSKRLATSNIERGGITVLINFNILADSVPWSLKRLMVYVPAKFYLEGKEPSDLEVEENFQYLLQNEERLTLILEGLDQSPFEITPCTDGADTGALNKTADRETYNKVMPPSNLIYLLLSRQLLPKCRLVLTSRPHAVISFDKHTQPDVTLYVNDLIIDDATTLLRHYLGGKAEALFKVLRAQCPGIFPLVTNPLLLRLIAMISCSKGVEVWEAIDTTTKMFAEVLDELKDSAHFNTELKFNSMIEKLAAIAYEATSNNTVIIKEDDIRKHELSPNDVQDLCSSLLVGKKSLYFNHQMFQV